MVFLDRQVANTDLLQIRLVPGGQGDFLNVVGLEHVRDQGASVVQVHVVRVSRRWEVVSVRLIQSD